MTVHKIIYFVCYNFLHNPTNGTSKRYRTIVFRIISFSFFKYWYNYRVFPYFRYRTRIH
ncbi:unnamed protein product [Meloidogyne enterolobii]|uniref:Uncharacterized protein n=1 Tax=Meloidogyne enterolobii TaxID=390850 RepID=A0ACB0ZKD0_MELEN